jgi:hypothetical protein
MEDAHAKTVDEIVDYFNVDRERGLTLDQVKRNQEKYGANGKLIFNHYYYCSYKCGYAKLRYTSNSMHIFFYYYFLIYSK